MAMKFRYIEAEAQVFALDTPKDVDEVLNYVNHELRLGAFAAVASLCAGL